MELLHLIKIGFFAEVNIENPTLYAWSHFSRHWATRYQFRRGGVAIVHGKPCEIGFPFRI
jgi:hypothetical protein